jgi:RNA polymerase sigma-70 factor (ECF subfamily)
MGKDLQFLIQGCQQGNQKAQLQVYKLYSEAMYFVACRYVKDEEEAKDIMQEGFLKAFQNIHKNIEPKAFGSWLKRIIINQCLDRLRKKTIETVSLENHPVEPVTDDENWNIDGGITREQVEKALEELPDKYQWVLKLYLMEGYDHTEISEILNITVKTSRTQLRRGKLLLQEQLKSKKDGTRSKKIV